jgi:hypothetical protein
MPKSLILLLLLCLVISPPALASALVLGPELPIAEPGFGAVSEVFVAVVPTATGLTAFTTDVIHQVLLATPLSPLGVPDLGSRHIVGPAASVVISKGEPLLFWSDGRTAYSARIGNKPNAIASTSAFRNAGAACNDQECLVVVDSFNNRVVITDSEGIAKTDAIAIPNIVSRFPGQATVVADPNGFTIFLTAGFLSTQRFVRVDHEGKVLWTVSSPDLTTAFLWNGDHNIVLAYSIGAEPSIDAIDLDANGNFGARRTLVKTAPTFAHFVFTRRGDRYVLAVRNGSVEDFYDVDSGWTTVKLTRSVPQEGLVSIGLVATDSALIAQVTAGIALGTMAIDPPGQPSLLSVGPLNQQAIGIAKTSSGYIVAWTELEAYPTSYRLYAAHVASDGTIIDRVQLAARISPIGFPIQIVGDDALIVWNDSDSAKSRGAVLHPGGTFESVEFETALPIRTIVARENDWVAITNPGVSEPSAAIRVTRSGFVYPAKPIPDAYNATLAAASDGRSIFVETVDQIVLLNADLDVARRIPHVPEYQGAVAFSNGSYLLADGEKLTKFDRNGNATPSVPFRSFIPPRLVSIDRGWLAIIGSTITEVLSASPTPVIGTSATIPNFAAIATRGDSRIGVLVSHPVDSHGLLSTRLFLRELSMEDVVRRRAVMSR